jgi:hypothetical protein
MDLCYHHGPCILVVWGLALVLTWVGIHVVGAATSKASTTYAAGKMHSCKQR